jgi:hypothetical protein
MSRITRYQTSFEKYIKDRSAIGEVNEADVVKYFNKYYKKGNFCLPILLLTILNSQNKKKSVSFHGYACASGIQYLAVINNILDNEPLEWNNMRICTILHTLVSKALSDNIQVIKRHLPKDQVSNVAIRASKLLAENTGHNGLFSNINIQYEKSRKSDLNKFIDKHYETKIYKKFTNIIPLTTECIDTILEKRICSISTLAVKLAWSFGSGNDKDSKRLQRIGNNFGKMFHLSNSFDNIENDIINCKDYTTNYVLNCGLSSSYHLFMKSKQEFIEDCMTLNILSITMKEIIDILEKKIDIIIDDSSPDLQSSYSSINKI